MARDRYLPKATSTARRPSISQPDCNTLLGRVMTKKSGAIASPRYDHSGTSMGRRVMGSRLVTVLILITGSRGSNFCTPNLLDHRNQAVVH